MKYFYTLLFVLSLAVSFGQKTETSQVAVVDFKYESFENNQVVLLNGNWEFYWKQLYTYDDFQSSKLNSNLITVPSAWNDIIINSEKCGSFGYATYAIKLKNLPKKNLILNAYSLQTASKIYFDDSLVAEVGAVGIDKQSSIPWNEDVQIIIPARYDSIQLIVQSSNFHHRKGGFITPFEIGSPETMIAKEQTNFVLDTLESSALMVIGLLLMALFAFRRKDKSILYFALFCMLLSLRPVIATNYMIGSFIQNLNWALMIKMEYLGTIAPALLIVLFIRELFPEQLSKKTVKIFFPIFILMIAVVLFAPIWIVSWLTYPIMVSILIGIVILTLAIIKAVMAKVPGAKFAGLGLVILFTSMILKILTYAAIIPAMDFTITVIDIVFIITMSLILGLRFSKQFVQVEILQEKTALQKIEIEEKSREIMDSINYAKRIQSAILPPAKIVKEYLRESFVLYKPKDIIAGDFYWLEHVGDKVLFAAADCTGHGVPGAMVSVVCNNGLNRSVREYGLTDPGEILDKTRELVIQEFEKSEEEVKDGMDIALCSLEGNILRYAGANNPLWIIRNGEVLETKANKQPIGKFDNHTAFNTHTFELQEGDSIYFFSDGYVDQFGGEKGKKFKSKAFKQLLISIQDKSMDEQRELIDEVFENWKGELDQIDDVCVIGVKV